MIARPEIVDNEKRSLARWRVDRALAGRVVIWGVIGLVSTVVGIPLLYVARDVIGLPLTVASLVVAELGIIVRFFANDRFVFGATSPRWRRLPHYHVASASSAVLWWAFVNAIALAGLHYILAAIVATACTSTFSLATNFLWVWSRTHARPTLALRGARDNE